MVEKPADTIQMSAYIDLDEYEEVELRHPYYKESMEDLINFVGSVLSKKSKILEVCGGTGFLTERLAQAFLKTEIVAADIDINCLAILKKKMAGFKNVKPLLADVATHHYGQQFDIIVSSISYHHIKLLERTRFWINIRSALKEGGYLIISDEFVPDFSTERERRKVTKYAKDYFITRCEEEGSKRTAELQKLFLNATLEGIEEYKISCKMLEHELEMFGFEILKKHKIGPMERDDVGGIYTYLTQKKPLMVKEAQEPPLRA